MEARRAHAAAQDPHASAALCELFLKSIILSPRSIISSYRARGSEMDPAILTEALRASGHTIVMPIMAGRDKPLVFRRYNPDTLLLPNALGIEEPGMDAPIAEPDILFVPLLAFDRNGGRLGTGGGYYDRTIQKLREKKKILACGIGFSCQEIPLVPVEPHDMRLDRIATEIQII
jgi:5-formyltetrahydrofolate cyclo-ligase